MMTAPCLNCERRCYPTCYGECEEYQAYLSEVRRVKKARADDRSAHRLLNEGWARYNQARNKVTAKQFIRMKRK